MSVNVSFILNSWNERNFVRFVSFYDDNESSQKASEMRQTEQAEQTVILVEVPGLVVTRHMGRTNPCHVLSCFEWHSPLV